MVGKRPFNVNAFGEPITLKPFCPFRSPQAELILRILGSLIGMWAEMRAGMWLPMYYHDKVETELMAKAASLHVDPASLGPMPSMDHGGGARYVWSSPFCVDDFGLRRDPLLYICMLKVCEVSFSFSSL